MTPCFHVERQFRRFEGAISQPCWQGPFLEYENGNVVFPDIVDQMRARRLVKIGHSASQQSEPGVLEFGQIEGERNLSLEPGLHRVTVCGDYIDRR